MSIKSKDKLYSALAFTALATYITTRPFVFGNLHVVINPIEQISGIQMYDIEGKPTNAAWLTLAIVLFGIGSKLFAVDLGSLFGGATNNSPPVIRQP